MNLIGIYGGGTIIGTALVIVLPESMMILIRAQAEIVALTRPKEEHSLDAYSHEVSNMIGSAILIGFAAMLLIDEAVKIITKKTDSKSKEKRRGRSPEKAKQ